MQARNWSVAGLGNPLESRWSCCGGWQGLEGRGVEDGVQERLGWRLKEGTGGLGMRAVGHVGERHGEDRGLY
jgi:hypothetical protein